MTAQIYPLLPPEVNAARTRAHEKFKVKLGKRPDRKAVASLVIRENRLNVVHWVGFFIFILMALVTMSKVAQLVALEVAQHAAVITTQLLALNPHGLGLQIDPNLQTYLFQFSYGTATELSLILFTIWYRITPRRKREAWYDVVYWLQYVPLVIVGLAITYIIQVNFAHGGNPIMNAFPVLVTLGVAVVFEEALMILIKSDLEVIQILRPLQANWDFRSTNWEDDAGFIELFIEELQGALINLIRRIDNRNVKPNEWLKDQDQDVLLRAVNEQFNRITAIRRASRREAERLRTGVEALPTATAQAALPRREQQVDAAGNLATLPQSDEQPAGDYGNGNLPRPQQPNRVVPPNGAWTATTLIAQLRRDNMASKPITIQEAQRQYSGVGRPLWNEVKAKLGWK